jgi:peptidoglycan/LPS O-acetylase OafA/YrhL
MKISSFSENITRFQYYLPPTYRLSEFIIGVLFGYFMHCNQKKNFETSKAKLIVCYLGWIIAIATLYRIIWSGLHQNPLPKTYFCNAIYRPMWSLAVCWIVYACHQLKTGGLIRWFLELSLWQPLSRIGLSTFIFHLIYFYMTDRDVDRKSSFGMWHSYTLHMNDILVTTVLGLIVYLFFEAPTGRLIAMCWTTKWKTICYFDNIDLNSKNLWKLDKKTVENHLI